MTRKDLFKLLNNLCSELDYNYNINSGGCCFVAAILAEQLENVNIPYQVIHYDEYSCHYAIKVSDRYLNRSDYKKKEISEVYESPCSDLLYEVYYDGHDNGRWNNRYNRKWNLIVYTKIKSIFKKYENSRT